MKIWCWTIKLYFSISCVDLVIFLFVFVFCVCICVLIFSKNEDWKLEKKLKRVNNWMMMNDERVMIHLNSYFGKHDRRTHCFTLTKSLQIGCQTIWGPLLYLRYYLKTLIDLITINCMFKWSFTIPLYLKTETKPINRQMEIFFKF